MPLDAGMLTQIEAFCDRHRLPWSTTQTQSMAQYVALLEQLNVAMNLIGPLTPAEILDQLVLDSLAAAAVAPPTGPILDVGTGAGLPGIPLKIAFGQHPITLVEPRQKRGTFLKIATTRLGLKQVRIENGRIEELAPGRYAYVISKAFQPPLNWLETASHWVEPEGGRILCLTRPHEREGLEARGKELGLKLVAGVDDIAALGLEPASKGSLARAVYAFGVGG